MSDVHDQSTRSYNMSQIKGKDTKPEILVRRHLHFKGFRFRLHVRKLPGRPDIVLPKYRTVIFIHGCFWHAHEGCKYFKLPKTRTEWWEEKLMKNRQRDETAISLLQKDTWKVIIIWECELKPSLREVTLKNLERSITKNKG